MPDQLPLFPLQLVVFPNEDLNLHIFEMRYRQLVNECLEGGKTFGIPPYIKDEVKVFGTEMEVVEVVKTYVDGKMDVKTRGLRTFQIHDFRNPMDEEKLYSGGDVEFFPNEDDANASERLMAIEEAQRLFELLGIKTQVDFEEQFLSYQIGHKIGLSLEQEYQLLTIPSESMRLRYLTEHLKRTYPVMEEMERTKDRIRMNGHFRHFDPLNF